MGNGSRFVMYTTGAVVFLMLLKDGTFNKLVRDASTGVQDFATGIRPITRVA